jgi:hypothetical protein
MDWPGLDVAVPPLPCAAGIRSHSLARASVTCRARPHGAAMDIFFCALHRLQFAGRPECTSRGVRGFAPLASPSGPRPGLDAAAVLHSMPRPGLSPWSLSDCRSLGRPARPSRAAQGCHECWRTTLHSAASAARRSRPLILPLLHAGQCFGALPERQRIPSAASPSTRAGRSVRNKISDLSPL